MRAATGSAHRRPKKASSSNPANRITDRYVQNSVWRPRARRRSQGLPHLALGSGQKEHYDQRDADQNNSRNPVFPTIVPTTTATRPTKAFHAIVKYSSLRPLRTTAARSKTAASAMSQVCNAPADVELDLQPRSTSGLIKKGRSHFPSFSNYVSLCSV